MASWLLQRRFTHETGRKGQRHFGNRSGIGRKKKKKKGGRRLFVVWSKTLLLPPAEIITKLVCVLFKPFFLPSVFLFGCCTATVKITRKEREILAGVVGRESREFELHERRALKSSGDYTAIVHSRRRICLSLQSSLFFSFFLSYIFFSLGIVWVCYCSGQKKKKKKSKEKKRVEKLSRGVEKTVGCCVMKEVGKVQLDTHTLILYRAKGTTLYIYLLAGWLAGFWGSGGEKEKRSGFFSKSGLANSCWALLRCRTSGASEREGGPSGSDWWWTE